MNRWGKFGTVSMRKRGQDRSTCETITVPFFVPAYTPVQAPATVPVACLHACAGTRLPYSCLLTLLCRHPLTVPVPAYTPVQAPAAVPVPAYTPVQAPGYCTRAGLHSCAGTR